MSKRLKWTALLLTVCIMAGCAGKNSEEPKNNEPEISVEASKEAETELVNENAEPEISEVIDELNPQETEDIPPAEEIIELKDYSEEWAEFPWTITRIPDVYVYATTTVNLRKEPHVKGEKAGELEYNEEVIALGVVENYGGDGLNFYIFDSGYYGCVDFFEKEVNVPDLGEGGLVYYKEGVYTYDEMVEDLLKLSEAYPEITELETIGVSVDGRDLYCMRIGQKSDKNFLIMAGLHADEYMNVPLAMEQMDMYLQNWDSEYKDGKTYGDILNECNICFMPCVNPDGITLVQLGVEAINSEELQAKISKIGHIKEWTANANGVDLNRNWDSYWNTDNAESSKKPAPLYYPGKKAFSEPETTAIRDWVKINKPTGCVSYHNQGRVIYWYSKQKKDSKTYKSCKTWAKAIEKLTGYVMGDETSNPRGMEANWFNLTVKIPCIQLETGRGDLPLPYSQWRTVWRDNKFVSIEMAYQNIKK